MKIYGVLPLLLLAGCSGAELRKAGVLVEEIAPVVGAAAAHVATSANPATGLIMAGATVISALLRTNLKGK